MTAIWMTTTDSFESHTIREYRGIVTGEAIMGTNFMKDWFANIRDVVGGRSGSYEKDLGKARQAAFAEMQKEAYAMGANGIVGIDIDYAIVGEKQGMMMVSVSGTAVIVQ
jgi:uncharacterized protein YbjQ (UPF0145 family)